MTPRQETEINQIIRETIETWFRKDYNDSFNHANNAVEFEVLRVTDEIKTQLER